MKKVLKGERERPCPRCEEPVRFLKSAWVEMQKQREGWHWINSNGTHHRCGDFVETGQEMNPHADTFHEGMLAMQWRQAMERDNGPYDTQQIGVK
uniref:Uncharacterized protein n=1 Tax=uncultured organism TaxID=155900 RepID=Q1EHX2_9ZZZZ|nr:hypothetical protein 10D02-33 [uncultured organism]